MDLRPIFERFDARHPRQIVCVDSHTAGEATRLVVGGVPEPAGASMREKRESLLTHSDHLRRLLVCEPRGHRDLLGALVTEPCTPGAAFGLIYFDTRRYPFLCGHATIGAVTTLVELGGIEVSGTRAELVVDTPSGPMQATAKLFDGKVESVAVAAVPSFAYRLDAPLSLPGRKTIKVDLVCVGGFFAMVDEAEIGVALAPENSRELIELGMEIIDLANEQLDVAHPERPEVKSVDVVEFHGEREGHGVNAVIYGEAHLDRSPCGTGTAAKLTLKYARAQLAKGETYLNRSFLGGEFAGRIIEETRVGDLPAVRAEIRGAAHVTGLSRFVLEPSDPFPQGFLP